MEKVIKLDDGKRLVQKPRVRRVAIVGGGPGSIAIYAELIRRYHVELDEILIFDPKGMMSSEAFSTELESCITNTSIGISSISKQDSLDLYRWLRDKNKGSYQPQDFVPRKLIKEYCLDRFDEAKEFAKAFGCHTAFIKQKVNRIDRKGEKFVITTEHNIDYLADSVVLATGGRMNNPYPQFNAYSTYVANPYPEENFLSKVQKEDRVLVIGTHLSAIDVCIGLLENQPTCSVTLVSPSGRLPAVKNNSLLYLTENFISKKLIAKKGKALSKIYDAMQKDLGGSSILNVPEHDLGEDIIACKQNDLDWQKVIASFADEINEMWVHLNSSERDDFKKSAARFLSEYIGAFPLQNAEKVWQGMQEGRVHVLKIDPSNFLSVDENQKFQGKGSLEGQSFDLVVNATGLNRDIEQHLQLRNSLSQGQDIFKVDQFMKVQTGQEYCPLYAIGGQAKHSSVLITNYIRALAVQADKVAEDMKVYVKDLDS